jgi:hypothetical protein
LIDFGHNRNLLRALGQAALVDAQHVVLNEGITSMEFEGTQCIKQVGDIESFRIASRLLRPFRSIAGPRRINFLITVKVHRD